MDNISEKTIEFEELETKKVDDGFKDDDWNYDRCIEGAVESETYFAEPSIEGKTSVQNFLAQDEGPTLTLKSIKQFVSTISLQKIAFIALMLVNIVAVSWFVANNVIDETAIDDSSSNTQLLDTNSNNNESSQLKTTSTTDIKMLWTHPSTPNHNAPNQNMASTSGPANSTTSSIDDSETTEVSSSTPKISPLSGKTNAATISTTTKSTTTTKATTKATTKSISAKNPSPKVSPTTATSVKKTPASVTQTTNNSKEATQLGFTLVPVSAAKDSSSRTTVVVETKRAGWIMPIDAQIIQTFETSEQYSSGSRGLRFDSASGDKVSAVSDGEVSFAGSVGVNKFVSVINANGLKSTYGNLKQIDVVKGDRVTQGEVIATTEANFSFTVRDEGNKYQNPKDYLPTQ